MWLNPFPIIWRSEPVRIELPPDTAAALGAVRARLPGWSIGMWFKEGAIGRVTESRVRLKRYRPLRRNDFAPLLDATISDADGTRALVGMFRASWPTRIFLSAWFGIAILFIPLFIIIGATRFTANDASKVIFMIGPLLIFLIGRGTLTYSQNHWNADKHYLEQFITESWAAPPRE